RPTPAQPTSGSLGSLPTQPRWLLPMPPAKPALSPPAPGSDPALPEPRCPGSAQTEAAADADTDRLTGSRVDPPRELPLRELPAPSPPAGPMNAAGQPPSIHRPPTQRRRPGLSASDVSSPQP